MSGGDTVALAAVQLAITAADLAGEASYAELIDRAARRASASSRGATHRLFVFPEATGHFAPLIYAPPAALRARSVARALAHLVARQPSVLLRGFAATRRLDLRRAVLAAVLPRVDDLVRSVYSRVARRYRATVVAGSHLRVGEGGRITNSSYTFDAGGRLIATTDKVNLVPGQEDDSRGGLGLSRGAPSSLPVVATGWGRLATLICYDGFREPHTRGERFVHCARRVDDAGAEVIANPAANPWPWNGRWVFAEHGETLLRREQWEREGLPATLAELNHVRYGVTAHLVCRMLGQRFEGVSEVLARHPDGRVEAIARSGRHDAADVVVARVPVAAAPRDLTASQSVATR